MTLTIDDEPHPVVAILEFRDGLVVRERIYIAEPWNPPAYRARWSETRPLGGPIDEWTGDGR